MPPASSFSRPTGFPDRYVLCGRWMQVPDVRYPGEMINGVAVVAAPIGTQRSTAQAACLASGDHVAAAC